MGKRRKGKCAKKNKQIGAEEPENLKRAPHSFVIHRGVIGKSLRALVNDFRKVMEPYTASRLKARKKNCLKDFVAVSGLLHVSHMSIFTVTEISPYLRVARLPQGPTLTFRLHEYALARDVVSAQRKQYTHSKAYSEAPLLIMNGFGIDSSQLKLVSTIFQSMFPTINITKVKLNDVKRCVLLNYDSESKTIDFRHYIIRVTPSGISKGIKKIALGKIPNLSKYEDMSDFIHKQDLLSDMSDAEEETKDVILPQKIAAKGNIVNSTSAIRLTEIGPRMKMQLIKVEGGLLNGEVMFHEYIQKTPEEIAVLNKERREKRRLKEKRRREQELNVQKKELLKAELKEKSILGMKMKNENESGKNVSIKREQEEEELADGIKSEQEESNEELGEEQFDAMSEEESDNDEELDMGGTLLDSAKKKDSAQKKRKPVMKKDAPGKFVLKSSIVNVDSSNADAVEVVSDDDQTETDDIKEEPEEYSDEESGKYYEGEDAEDTGDKIEFKEEEDEEQTSEVEVENNTSPVKKYSNTHLFMKVPKLSYHSNSESEDDEMTEKETKIVKKQKKMEGNDDDEVEDPGGEMVEEDDDDVEWYRKEIGQEPEPELFGSGMKRRGGGFGGRGRPWKRGRFNSRGFGGSRGRDEMKDQFSNDRSDSFGGGRGSFNDRRGGTGDFGDRRGGMGLSGNRRGSRGFGDRRGGFGGGRGQSGDRRESRGFGDRRGGFRGGRGGSSNRRGGGGRFGGGSGDRKSGGRFGDRKSSGGFGDRKSRGGFGNIRGGGRFGDRRGGRGKFGRVGFGDQRGGAKGFGGPGRGRSWGTKVTNSIRHS